MICIEGENCNGKSTLIERLLVDLQGYVTRKESKPPYDGFKYYLDTSLNSNIPNETIFDRFHLGESVYPAIKTMENRKPLDSVQQHMIERVLLSRGSILILAETDEETTINNFRTRGEEYTLESEVKKGLELFNVVYNRSILPKIKYDYRDPNSYNKVLKFIKKNHYVTPIVEKTESCGNWHSGTIMLVGDTYADGTFVHTHDARALISTANSSLHLHKALELTEKPETYYITNAHKFADQEENVKMLKNEYDFLNLVGIKVIALGKLASKTLTQANIPHTTTNHPQWWRRFKNKELQQFADTLK